MKYKIIVDKQSRTNPTSEKREYEIDIEELRCKGDVYDSLIITKEEDYVIRRLSLSKYQVLSVLDEPKREVLNNINIELFEGDNYIYLLDMTGNKFYAEYLVKNDFNDTYVTYNSMNSAINQTAREIDLSVNQKLEGYSTTEEMNAAIKLIAEAISLEVSKKLNEDEFSTKLQVDYESVQIAWNKISEFIQFINAQLQIKDNQKKLLMALDKLGMHFYKSSGSEIGDIGLTNDTEIAFAINGAESGNAMVWGIKRTANGTTKFFPVFRYGDYNIEDGTEFGGLFTLEAPMMLQGNPIFLGNDSAVPYILGDDNGNVVFGNIDSGCYFNDGGGNTIFSIDPNTGAYVQNMYANNLADCNNLTSLTGSVVTGSGTGTNYGVLNVILKDGTGFALNTSITTSDERLKENIKDSQVKAIDIIKQLKHRTFTWKETGQKQEVGYVAQELEKIDKNFIFKIPQIDSKGNKVDEIYNVNMLPILSTVTKAMQEQQEKIQEQHKIIESLIKRIEKLEEAQNGKN